MGEITPSLHIQRLATGKLWVRNDGLIRVSLMHGQETHERPLRPGTMMFLGDCEYVVAQELRGELFVVCRTREASWLDRLLDRGNRFKVDAGWLYFFNSHQVVQQRVIA